MEAGEALKFAEQFEKDHLLLNSKSFFPEYFKSQNMDGEDDHIEEDEDQGNAAS